MSKLGFAISGRPTGQDTLANGLFQELGLEDSLYFSGLSGDIILEQGEQVVVIAQRKGQKEEQAIIIALFEYAESFGPNRPGGFIGAAVALRGLPKPQLLGKVIFDLFKSAATLIDPTTRKFKSASKKEWNLELPAPDDSLLGNFPNWFLKSPLKTDERVVIQTAGDIRLILWSIAQAAILNPQFNGKGTIMVTGNNSFVTKAVAKGFPKVGMFELFDYQILHEKQLRKLGEAQRELFLTKTNIEQEAKIKKTIEDQSSHLRILISEQENEVRKIEKRKNETENHLKQLEERRINLENTNREFEQSLKKGRQSFKRDQVQEYRQSEYTKSQIELELNETKKENIRIAEGMKFYKYLAISACSTLVVFLVLFTIGWPPFQETIFVPATEIKPKQQQVMPAPPEKAIVPRLTKKKQDQANIQHRAEIKDYVQKVATSNDKLSVQELALRGFLFREVLQIEDSHKNDPEGSLKSEFKILSGTIEDIESLLKSNGIEWKFGSDPNEQPKFLNSSFDKNKKEISDTLRYYNLLYLVDPNNWKLETKTFTSAKADNICKEYLSSNNDIYKIISDEDINKLAKEELMIAHLRWMIIRFNESDLGSKDADISLSNRKTFKVPVLKK